MIDYYNDLLENDEIREAVEKIDNKVSFEMQISLLGVPNTLTFLVHSPFEQILTPSFFRAFINGYGGGYGFPQLVNIPHL